MPRNVHHAVTHGRSAEHTDGSNDDDGEDDVDVMIMNIKGFSMFLS